MEDKYKCEEIGFLHNWQDITPNIVYSTMPPQYPPKERECVNCGKKQIEVLKQSEIIEWEEIS
jgi:hypothetical protein